MSGDQSTRWSVILRAAEGVPLDRDEFVRRYASVIEAYLRARWKGSDRLSNVEDAIQDVFVEFLRDDGALSRVDRENRGGFRTYLFAVVRNVARRCEQRDARQRNQPLSGVDTPAREEPASRAFERAWAASIMDQARQLMIERARTTGDDAIRRVELLRLRFREDRPTREIAAEWGMKAAQIQYQYKCARDEFQAALIEIVRRHDPTGDIDEECRRLIARLGQPST